MQFNNDIDILGKAELSPAVSRTHSRKNSVTNEEHKFDRKKADAKVEMNIVPTNEEQNNEQVENLEAFVGIGVNDYYDEEDAESDYYSASNPTQNDIELELSNLRYNSQQQLVQGT